MGSTAISILVALFLVLTVVLGVALRYYQKRCCNLMLAQEESRQQREAVVNMLNRIGLRINASLDLDGALQIISEFLVEATHAGAGAIFLLDAEGEVLQARALVGLFPPMHETTDYVLTKRKYLDETIRRDKIALGEGIIGFVAKTGEPLLISDALSDPRVPRVATDYLKINSMIVAPLRIRQRTLGVLALVNRTNQDTFDDQDMRLVQQLAAQAALTVDVVHLYEHEGEQRRIEQELRVAHEFQAMLLPAACPEPEGLDVAAYASPALELGGDYYDFIWVEKPRYLGVAIVDVSGKGIPAALVLAMLRSALRASAPGCHSPKEVLTQVNRSIVGDTKQGVFLTMTYAIIEVVERRIRFARGGHEPMIIWSETSTPPRRYQPNGIGLGLVGDEIFNILEEEETEIGDGETLVLYTDGVVEAVNAEQQEYGIDRFLERLEHCRGLSAAQQIEAVIEDIRIFTQETPQHDDTTLVAIRAVARE